ncbi:MAG: hypothetical protein RL318_755 [Fibrobacterota bacterium]|jgi:outer membrane protein TolC
MTFATIKRFMPLGLLAGASAFATGSDSSVTADAATDSVRLAETALSRSPSPSRPAMEPVAPAVKTQPLTLDAATRIVIRTNPDIQQARARWLGSISVRKSAWGDFEPRLTGKYNHQKTTLPGPWNELKDEYKLGVQGLLPTTTQYDLGFRHTGTLHSATLSDAFFGLTLRQPVLRGVWYDGAMSNLRIASDEERKLYHQLRSGLSQTLGKLHSSYWDCFYASRLLEFEDQSVRIAQDLLRDGSQRIASGKISSLDLEKLSSELALRLSRRHEARKMLEESRNQFALLLSGSDSVWPHDFEIALPAGLEFDSLSSSRPRTDSIELLHPDVLAQRFDLARAEKSMNAHKNLRLPQVDLIGSYGYSSTAKTGHVAMRQFQDAPQTQMSAGVEIEFPLLGNIKERQLVHSEEQNVRASKSRLQQYLIQLRKQADLLQEQVTRYVDQVRQERIAVKFHQNELESEYVKLKAGKSNIHPVYEIEEKLRDAQRRLLDVLRSCELARMELDRTHGHFLRQQGIESFQDGESLLLEELLLDAR